MKLLIVGLGVIGTGYGWAFTEAGSHVTHLVRPGRAQRYEGGIDLDLLDLRPGHLDTLTTTYSPTIVEDVSPGDAFELVMVPVKHYQLAETLRGLKDETPAADFLLFAANWDGPQAVDELLPRSRYVWGYAASTGGHGGDVLVFNMSDRFRFGPIGGEQPPWAQRVVDLFAAAAVEPDWKPDMLEWLWVHFAIAAGLIGTALYVGGQQELMQDEAALRDLLAPAVRESLQVLERRGVDVGS